MPSKKIVCEFCQTPSTKQAIAGHIKTKHAKEVGNMLFQEWKEGENITPIKQYMEARPIRNIPIASRLYDGAVYWFGPDPRFFDEDESYAVYIKSQDNLDGHRAFLEECLGHISLMDFIDCEREYQVKSQEAMEMKRQFHELQKKVLQDEKEFIQEVDRKDITIQRLRDELDDIKQSSDNPQTIHELQNELKEVRLAFSLQTKQLNRLKSELDGIEQKHERIIEQMYNDSHTKRKEQDDLLDTLNQKYQILKTANEKLQTNLKKEAQKIVDAQAKEKKKEKEKARKAREAAEEAVYLAKMKARRTSPKHKKRYSSSSSDSSSSDSDSD